MVSQSVIKSAIKRAESASKISLSIAEKSAAWDKSTVEMTDPERWHCKAAAVQVQTNTDALEKTLHALYGDAMLQGVHEASAASNAKIVSGLTSVTDTLPADYWSTWTPGFGDAATRAADGGMREMLDEAGIRLKGISETTTDDIGNTIAKGLETGRGSADIAKEVTDAVASPARAEMIANTEYCRAMTVANVQTYAENEIQQVEWLAEGDACPECESNADGSPFDLGDAPTPPAHPNCRCALAPIVEGAEEHASI